MTGTTNTALPAVLGLASFNADHGEMRYRGATLAALRAAGLPEAAILAGVQARLRDLVDEAAEAARLRRITSGNGQAMEYAETQAQAVAALASPAAASAERFPMLAASIGLDVDPQTGAPAADVLGVARAVVAAYDAWVEVGGAIRRARLAGKAAIGATATVEAAAAAYTEAVAALLA
ncbi:hypothetical protein [Methylobacterium aquaticum]|uniref:Uncharacterized protein n=1 Tax=Methylobacterium aquaticum TaxID=270351 RepID=A0A0C6FXT2_9HYPH|nr:hypothetical protein [Methylobacterium aquaticum]BAQ50414.1 hypothetical protein Maq22A_4p60330 [Methylobacterium aquaticum]